MKLAYVFLLTVSILVLLNLVSAAIETGELEIRLVGGSWNPIGVPYEDSIVDDSDCRGNYVKKVYYWNPYERRYRYVDSLRKMEGGKGYWVYAKDDCVIRIRGSTPVKVDNVDFYPGWNFISSMQSNGKPASRQDLETKCHVEKGPYYYNPTKNKWEIADKLEDGKGYWVKCSRLTLDNCRLDETNWKITCDTNCKQVEGKPTIVVVVDKDKNVAVAFKDDVSKGEVTIRNGRITFSTEPSLSMLSKDRAKWKVILICNQPVGQVVEDGVR